MRLIPEIVPGPSVPCLIKEGVANVDASNHLVAETTTDAQSGGMRKCPNQNRIPWVKRGTEPWKPDNANPILSGAVSRAHHWEREIWVPSELPSNPLGLSFHSEC